MDATLTSGVTPLMALLARGWLAESAVDPRVGQIELAPHQVEAVARVRGLLRDYGGAVLADETGMGKTYVALAVSRDFGPCFVVAPAGLRTTWEQALARTGVRGRFVSFERLSRAGGSIRERHRDASERQHTAGGLHGAGEREQGAIAPAHHVALVIVDEAHHVRNPRTRRHEALARLVWGTPVLLLTATPVHNRLRDLRSQLALFLGAAADSLGMADLARLVVRRRHEVLAPARRLPVVEPVHWLGVDPAPGVLRAIVNLPPAVPPADGGTAHALLRLGLVRAWSSSHAALRAALRHRLHRATALTAALDAGRFPTQAELRAWSVVDDALQLAFPELTASTAVSDEMPALRDAVSAHVDGIHRLQAALDASPDLDEIRADHLRALARRHAGTPIVAFTHFAETAIGLGRRLASEPGLAVVTARGARIASGRVPRQEIIARLAPDGPVHDARLLPLRLVLATDVLSEGLNLQQAGVLVHLDLPWTVARLEQRLGRLLRIGSPHARLHAYAIGPPVHGRELLTVVRALQRKARLLRGLVGAPEIAVHEPLLGARLRRLALAPSLDLASATEALRAALQGWRATTDSDDAEDSATQTAHDDSTDLPLEVRIADALDVPWSALTLVRTGARRRLLAIEPGLVSEDPRALLAWVRRWCAAAPAWCELDGSHDDAVADVQRELDRWLAERDADALAALALDAPSAAHARVIRWLDALVARAPRHERLAVADAVGRCRHLVLAARGAGAERYLAEWLEVASSDEPPGGMNHVATLANELTARGVGPTHPRRTGSEVIAVLLLAGVSRTTDGSSVGSPERQGTD